MDVKLTTDELAVMRWIYERPGGFGKDIRWWGNVAKKELNLSDERFHRVFSALEVLGLLVSEKSKIEKPQPEEGYWIRLTADGIRAYRNAVPDEQWNMVPDFDYYKRIKEESQRKAPG